MNALTNSALLVEDRLFATLDSTTRLLEEDSHEFIEGEIGEGRSAGAISGMALIQNIEATNPTA